MENPFIKTELVGRGPFDFWRTKLYELLELFYRRMETDGKCSICLSGNEPHKATCGFANIEMDIATKAEKERSFWKTKLDELEKVIADDLAQDAICPLCLGSWSCKDDCGYSKIKKEIAEHKTSP